MSIIEDYHKMTAIEKVDGGNGSYYDLVINGVTVSCNDVIDMLNMSFNRGEAFKALWRCGAKPGTDTEYDLKKVAYFAKRELERVNRK